MNGKVSTKVFIIGIPPTLASVQIQNVVDPAIGLVSKASATSSLELDCPSGDQSDNGDWYEVYMRDKTSPIANAWTQIAGPAQFTIANPGDLFRVTIPAPAGSGGFPHGEFEICHQLFVNKFADPAIPGDVDRPSDVGEQSAPVPVTFDQYGPYESVNSSVRPSAPIYTGTLPAGTPVTATFLASAGGLTFSVPDNTYAFRSGQWDPLDTIQFYWTTGDAAVPSEEVGGLIPPRPMTQTGNVFTLLPGEVTNSGVYKLIYTITDRLGHVSLPSIASAPFTVALTPPPVLEDILIDQAPAPRGGSTDRLINVKDYVSGVTGQILAYTNHLPAKDEFQFKWGNQPWTQWFGVPQLPFTLDTALLTPLILADYGTTKGVKPTDLQYRIRRDGEEFPSPTKTIDVNLSVTGPDNPGTPGSPNTRLLPLNMFGQPDAAPVEPNVLRFPQAGNTAFAEIVLWTGSDAPAPGMWIHVVRPDGTLVTPPYPITTEVSGQTIRVPVAWSNIEAGGNGVQNFHYFVASTAAPTADDNRNDSPPTPVQVLGAVTASLPAPQFTGAVGTGANNQWNCDSLVIVPVTTPKTFQGRIFVQGDPRMVLGQQLTLALRIFRPRTGTPIFDNTQTYSVPITPAIIASGHTFLVPFSFLVNARLGRAEVVVTAPLAGNTLGVAVSGLNVRTTLSQNSCDLSPIVGP
ncbi:hypothetical protein HX780_00850 [Pseudomonas tolaasii]|uniref:hypothetical protein n=1 Tax=Pseudomonas tolaasii TaxID=29442 RepID=UPI0015A00ECB|nr:hypothetical protein [Pseudomonas tolaasii]NVZ47382.1 hypothetical protein [Pseudomonas tolaasii]NWA46843.1 hypothetical protein [Pseudomonas tolaasii]